MARTREQTGDAKERIDRAAIHLFAEIGVDATPVPLLAQRAGVAVGSVYRHYDSKDDLVQRLYAEHFARLADMLDDAQAGAEGARLKLAAMIRSICCFIDEEWDVARFLLLEQHVRLKNYEQPANPVDVVRRVLAEGMRRGEVRGMDPMIAASLVMGPVVQAATFRTYGRIAGPLAEWADELVEGCWAAVAENRGKS